MQRHNNYQLIHQFNTVVLIFKRPLSLNVTFKKEISDFFNETNTRKRGMWKEVKLSNIKIAKILLLEVWVDSLPDRDEQLAKHDVLKI